MAQVGEALVGWLVVMGMVFGGVTVVIFLATTLRLTTVGLTAMRDRTCIICSRELYGLLRDLEYPANKRVILAYAQSRGATENEIKQIRCLPRLLYRSIDEVCCNSHQLRLELGS